MADGADTTAISANVGQRIAAIEKLGQHGTIPDYWRGPLAFAFAADEVAAEGLLAERDKFMQHKDAWKVIAEEAKAERDRLREALEWLASEDAWEVTPQYQTDGRYRFNTLPNSPYATPWGFAREALKEPESAAT